MSDARTDYAGIAAQVFPFSALERQRLIEPIMAFYESVNELRDDQKLHLITLYQYHQALGLLAAAEERAERDEVLDAAREVVREGDHAWREHAHDIRALGSHMQYYVLPAISRLRRMLDALDATDGAAKETT